MKSNEVPPGYKQTEMGVIPDNWSVLPLRACLFKPPSYGINAAAVTFDDNLPAYLRITDIDDENRFRPAPRVSVKHANATMFFLGKGDLVFARTGASVGKSYLYNPNDGALVFAGFLIRVSPDPALLEPAFLAHYVQSKRYWDWVATMSIRSGQPGINGQEYGTLQVPLPETKEQRAIASALSDVDALLAALDKLIAKKRAIKQAAMQQLLTGKTRLPGFEESPKFSLSDAGMIPQDWQVRRLAQCLRKAPDYGINAPATSYEDTLPTYLRITDIDEDGRFLPSPKVSVRNPNADRYILAEGDLVFARTGASVGKSYLYQSRDGLLVFAGFLIRVTPDPDILDPDFLAHYVRSKNYWDWVTMMSARSGQPGINGQEFGHLDLPLPDRLEQQAIATILSDMDAEIAALERRRDKTQQIKQGMMQELLTGSTRLV